MTTETGLFQVARMTCSRINGINGLRTASVRCVKERHGGIIFSMNIHEHPWTAFTYMSHISYIHCRGEAEEKVKICGPLGLELSDNSLSNAARGAINVSKRAPLLYEKSWHEINTLSTLPFSKLQTFGMQKCNTLMYAHCMLHIVAWYPMISDGLRVCFCLVPRGRHGWSSRWQGRHQSSLKNAARKRIRVNMVILWSRHGLLESIEKKRIPWSHTKLPQPSPVMTILGPSWSCFCVSCWHIFGVQLQACFFWAIGLSGLPFSPIPSAAFGLQQSLATVTNQFQDAQRCLDLLDSCLVLFTIYIVHCCSLFQSWFWKLRMYRIFVPIMILKAKNVPHLWSLAETFQICRAQVFVKHFCTTMYNCTNVKSNAEWTNCANMCKPSLQCSSPAWQELLASSELWPDLSSERCKGFRYWKNLKSIIIRFCLCCES